MPSLLPIIMGAISVVYISLLALQRLTQDQDEPKPISDGIPFVTPILNMISKGGNLHRVLSCLMILVLFQLAFRDQYKLPIYTLRLPGMRMYVVNSRPLITAIQGQFRTLSFTAIEAAIAANVIGVEKATNDIIGSNLGRDSGYLMRFPKYVHHALSAGPGLDAMNRKSIQVLADSLDKWATSSTPATVPMFEWVRHELLLASTDAVYGPKNPFRDPAMEKAWYEFEPKLMVFVLNLWPRVLAAKAFRAREYMVQVWERYFDEGWHEQGSELIKTRVKINDDFQIPLKETARIEIGGSQAILTNTLPAAFWVAYHVFSDPVVLADIRSELLQGVTEDPAEGTCTIDLNFVTSSCPILLSTMKETMRIHNTNAASRIVMEDYRLDQKILLKKGSTILMPAHVQHTDRDVWGDDVDVFNHRRFLRGPSGGQRVNPVAFRGFGGGTTLCPGRHFATSEMLMLAALLALRFDISPASGKWVAPTTRNSPSSNAMPVPDWDFDVALCPRDGGKKTWKVSFSGHKRAMEISAEDMEGATPHLGG
ncbi:cytochrome P450 oxidoreductase [Apiospora marii]|uniref:Cytochrome P450 oxidoreductase n=1 Tax=Apiospora marii TaxID=335849 RepID=A0ABR1R0S8_9PEZI